MKIQNDNYKSVWVEIKEKLNGNIITGCIYRQPRYNLSNSSASFDCCQNRIMVWYHKNVEKRILCLHSAKTFAGAENMEQRKTCVLRITKYLIVYIN